MFLIADSISILSMGLFRFSFSSGFSLRKLYDCRNLPISPRLSDLLNIIAHSNCYDTLYFCGINCNVFSLFSDFEFSLF